MPLRPRLLAALAVVTPLGFATKAYSGPGLTWVRGHLGGVLYEIFWILAILALRPRLPAARVAGAVLLVTCGIEVLQLWHPPVLEALRSHFLGRTLLGNSFSWWDFPHYAIGCALGVLLVRALGVKPEP